MKTKIQTNKLRLQALRDQVACIWTLVDGNFGASIAEVDGKPIRYMVEEKGRFVPATLEKWIADFAIRTLWIDDSSISVSQHKH